MNKKNSQSIKSILNFIDFPDLIIKTLSENLQSVWDFNNKDNNIKPQDIIFNIQNILKDKSGVRTDKFWMQHCSSSLRELLDKDFENLFKNYSVKISDENYLKEFEKIVKELKLYKTFLNEFAHVNKNGINSANELSIFENEPIETINEENFNKILTNFIKMLFECLENQIEIHKKIDDFLSKKPEEIKVQKIRSLISISEDVYKYFYLNVSADWFNQLLKNNFFDVIKKKPPKSNFPELWYLSRKVSKVNPKQVVDIMLDIKISKDNPNHQNIICWFKFICISLPANELVRIFPKIRNEKWIQLSKSSFEYSDMFKILVEGKKYDDILIFTEILMEVKTKEDFELKINTFTEKNYFFLRKDFYIDIFKHLININDKYAEKMLEILCETLSKIVKLQGEKTNKNAVFILEDNFFLSELDLFTLNLNEVNLFCYDDSTYIIGQLLASIKQTLQKMIIKHCENNSFINSIYNKYFKTLPNSFLMWRLKLFVMSLYPNIFQNNLKCEFLKLFDSAKTNEDFYEIQSGTEYKKALKKSFKVFDLKFQHKFVGKVFEYFGKTSQNQQFKNIGWEILSSVCEFLSNDEKNKCKKIFGRECDSGFLPKPASYSISGTISSRPELSDEKFNNLSIANIIEKLKTKWEPDKLDKNHEFDDLNPIDADGISSQLQRDIVKRPREYISNANLFFDINSLHENYTCSFFEGIHKFINANPSQAKLIVWDKLIDVMITISESAKDNFFYQNKHKQINLKLRLSNWNNVFVSVINILELFWNTDEEQKVINFDKFRDKFFQIIIFFLNSPNPTPKDEELKNGSYKYKLILGAIRKQAFKAFFSFVYHDVQQNPESKKHEIKQEIKDVYEMVLKKENTRTLMFEFGRSLSFFFFCDKDWIQKLLSQIFPADKTKQDLYIASWMGYLSKTFPFDKNMFFDSQFQKLYERGFELIDNEYSNCQYFFDLNKNIAIHIAIPFIIHYKKFGFENKLFKKFWEKNIDRQINFINFIGQNFIVQKDTDANKELKNNPEMIKHVQEFWTWVLKNHNDSKILKSFGFWINAEENFFDRELLVDQIKKTLEKTNGVLNWEFNLEKYINEFAKINPSKTLEIVRLFLLEGKLGVGKGFFLLKDDSEWVKVLKTLHEIAETQNRTRKLIDNLILKESITLKFLKDI